MERERSLGRRAPLLWLLLPLLAGLALGRALPPGAGGKWWLAGAAAGLGMAVSGLVSTGRAARGRWAAGLIAAGFCGGVADLQWHEHRLAIWERLPPREAEVVLQVEFVFPAGAGRPTVSGFARIESAPRVIAETTGQLVYFSLKPGDGLPEVLPTSCLRTVGVLEPVARHPAGGGFDAAVADAGAGFRLTRGRVLGETRPASGLQRFYVRARHRFEHVLGLGLDRQPELRAMYVAILLGRKAELSGEQRELFKESGTMHLVVVSGLHIAVIWEALSVLLAALRVPRIPATALGLALLYLYVEITGAAPAAMRAWLMIFFVLAGGALSWPPNPLAGITASALVVVLVDPWVFFGASFRMSYGVVAALLLYGLTLDERLQRRWRPWAGLPEANWGWWRKAIRWIGRSGLSGVSISVTAGLVSALTSVSIFGILTPGSLATNVLLVPVALFAVVAGFAALVTGLAGLAPVAAFFNHAGIVVLWVVEHALATAVRWPVMHWPAEFRTAWLGSAALAVLLAVMFWGYGRGWRRSIGGLWLPVGLVLLVVLLGVRHGAPASAAGLPAPLPPAIAHSP